MIDLAKATWDREYTELQVIPSSTRFVPSKALVLFSELVGFAKMKHALDAGCGNGRNSLYLAGLGLEVHAVDFSGAALDETCRRAKEANLQDRISVHESNLERPFPFESNFFDLCLDSYVFCHFLNDQVKHHYVSELWRVTKPGGYTFSSLFAPWDEYYARFVGHPGKSNIVKDPANGIVKVLYTKQGFKDCFSPPFDIKYFVEFEFDDIVQGVRFRRNILGMVLHKPAV
ncbi:MAG: class I SAM-dependent methyltransferase [Nitrososphaera sp.]|nr:class I SAM-dependent methyltransferase [Nitrososphaera sp.]